MNNCYDEVIKWFTVERYKFPLTSNEFSGRQIFELSSKFISSRSRPTYRRNIVQFINVKSHKIYTCKNRSVGGVQSELMIDKSLVMSLKLCSYRICIRLS